MKKMLSWKFQLHSMYGAKIIILWILPKTSRNCILSAPNKIFPTLDSNISLTKKNPSDWDNQLAFHPNKSFLFSAFIENASF